METQALKRSSDASSSNEKPNAKQKAKATGDKRDAEASPEKRPKAKAKPSKDEALTLPAPKPRGRPKKDPNPDTEPEITKTTKPPKKTIEKEKPREKAVHGTKTETHTFEEWSKKGKGYLIDQIDLRKIPITKTERIRMTKKDLVNKILAHDK